MAGIPVSAILSGLGTVAQLAATNVPIARERHRQKQAASMIDTQLGSGNYITPAQEAVLDQGGAALANATMQGQRRAEQLAAAGAGEGAGAAELAGIRGQFEDLNSQRQLAYADARQRFLSEAEQRLRQAREARLAAAAKLGMTEGHNTASTIGDVSEALGGKNAELPSGAQSFGGAGSSYFTMPKAPSLSDPYGYSRGFR